MGVSLAGGYIAGVGCGVVGCSADVMVSRFTAGSKGMCISFL